MRLSHQIVAAIFAATAASSAINIQIQIPGPETEVIRGRTFFALMALRSASPVHFSPISAYQSSLSLLVSDQHATCPSGPPPSPNHAIFYLEDNQLFLYTGEGHVPSQQVYVGMEEGGQTNQVSFTPPILGLDPPTRFIPEGAVTAGWDLSDGDLTFRGQGLLACPPETPSLRDAGWKIFVDTLVDIDEKAACLGFGARALPVSPEQAVGCTYE